MRHAIVRLSAILATVVVFSTTGAGAVQAPDRLDARGEPRGLGKSAQALYKVWHNEDGWHLQLMTSRAGNQFTGSIKVIDGYLTNVRSDLFKQGQVDPRWKQALKRQEIAFNFRTFKEREGLHFTTTPTAKAIRFTLAIDGKERPRQIYVGRQGQNPDSGTFLATTGSKTRSVAGTRKPSGGLREIDPRGEPAGLRKLNQNLYKLWHNENGWHLKIATNRGGHQFTGSIAVVGGFLRDVRSDLVKQGQVDPRWKQGRKQDEIAFDFKTYSREEGIHFKTTADSRAIRFSLLIDGREVPVRIYIGKNGEHPEKASFAVVAHPRGADFTKATPRLPNLLALDPKGEPGGLRKGNLELCKVWHNENGWHLHFLGDQRQHRFNGSIEVVDGYLTNLQSTLFREGKLDPRIKQTSNRKEISFDFTTFKGEEKIGFRTSSSARAIRFTLYIDGKSLPRRIFVGKNGKHPEQESFAVAAHPGKQSRSFR